MLNLIKFSRIVLRNSQLIKNVVNESRVNSVFIKKFSDQNVITQKTEIPGIRSKDLEEGIDKKLIAAQDPDTFGTLSINVQPAEDDLQDPDDIKEEQYLKNPPKQSQKLRTKQYADLIKDHLKNKRIKEAIDVLEVRMIQEDRVKPESYIYNLLISGCAQIGFSKKAFQLYNKMKQRGLQVTGGTYTSLFNACANAPFIGDGLNKANRLRSILIEKGYDPNASNYNAMIKAYGRCGDVKTAFTLVDEMLSKNLPVQVNTFNFLLQACASDKELGFRHALLVWHKMYQRKLSPDIYSFNLILRCCRDTNLGDLETTHEVIQAILMSGSEPKLLENEEKPLIGDTATLPTAQEPQTEVFDPSPNLIAVKPHLGSLIELREITKPEDRLLLLGGFSGFLDVMKHFNVEPTVKTFTELLDVIPPTLAAEKKLLSTMKKFGVKCDIDFFNILIKKRSMRFDYVNAKDVLKLIRLSHLEPDIVTYGVLSLGCRTVEEARELLAEMEEKEIRMNMYILGAMLRQGSSQLNFEYVLEILEIVRRLKLKPSEKFLQILDNFAIACKKIIRTRNRLANKEFKSKFNQFNQVTEQWKLEMGFEGLILKEAVQKVKEHPWEQFQQPQAQGFEETKNPNLRKKKKKFHNLKLERDDEENPKLLS